MRRPAFAFSIFFLPICILLAGALPPFAAPDDGAHMARAISMAEGDFVAVDWKEGRPVTSVDSGYGMMLSVYNQNRKAAYDDKVRTELRAFEWTGKKSAIRGHAALYYPAFYIPQTLTVLGLKTIGASPFETVVFGRLILGLQYWLAGLLVLLLAPSYRLYFLTLLILPLVTVLGVSFSPDPWLIISAALSIAACLRLLQLPGDQSGTWLYVLAVITMSAVGATKLPYMPVALFVVIWLCRHAWANGNWRAMAWTFILFMCWVGSAVAWNNLIEIENLQFLRRGLQDVHGQRDFLLGNPAVVFDIAITTVKNVLPVLLKFLGFEPSVFPSFLRFSFSFQSVALGIFLVLAQNSDGRKLSGISGQTTPWWVFFVGWLGLLLAIGGIFLALYLTWTDVGVMTVRGVQGRYFFPLLPVLLLLVPTTRPGWLAPPTSLLGTLWITVASITAFATIIRLPNL